MRQPVTVTLYSGPVTIDAWVIGGTIAVHHPIISNAAESPVRFRRGWMLTHAGSGYAVAELGSLHHAVRLAAVLAPLLPASLTYAEARANPATTEAARAARWDWLGKYGDGWD